jgi:hypothetical protein
VQQSPYKQALFRWLGRLTPALGRTSRRYKPPHDHREQLARRALAVGKRGRAQLNSSQTPSSIFLRSRHGSRTALSRRYRA